MNKALKYGLWGFIFGTVGLYALAMLSLISSIFEIISAPLMYPGRWAAETFVGSSGSTMEVVTLTLFNGLVFAILFALVGSIVRSSRT